MDNEQKTVFNLNMHTARLLMDEPFFASLSRRVNKTSSTMIPTAGVRVNTETAQFEMLYNPEFFAQLSDVHKAGVLKHEFYHLIFEHVTSRKPEGINPLLWNFATDLAINSHLEGELPDSCLMPGVGKFAEYKKGLSAGRVQSVALKMLVDREKERNRFVENKFFSIQNIYVS